MTRRDGVELLILAAIWGSSFLFMRVAVGDFGPLALAFVRVLGAALVLLALLCWQGAAQTLLTHWRGLLLVGVLNSVLPFALFNFAAQIMTAGLMSIFNATTPLAGALVAWLWLRHRPTGWRAAGLGLGFAGVVGLVWQQAAYAEDAAGVSSTLATLACLLATVCYAISANFTRERLTQAPPLAVAAGSQLAATLVLAPLAWWTWPALAPSPASWSAAIALALLCTGVAYWLYFRLIAHAGSANAMAVTYLIPLFALLWGAVFLGESVDAPTLASGLVILGGTALATGLIRRR